MNERIVVTGVGVVSVIEAVACCLTAPAPECDIDCVPNASRKAKVNIALNNASAFGGNNGCVAFGKSLAG